jgi:hypothetical protein
MGKRKLGEPIAFHRMQSAGETDQLLEETVVRLVAINKAAWEARED